MDSNVDRKLKTDGRPMALAIPAAKGNKKAKQPTGTKEWAAKTVNFCNGCSHACIYCYARHMAVTRFHRMSHEDWPNEVVREHDVRKKRHRIEGPVMVPSTHDITPGNIDAAETVLLKLLEAGNNILIVSKPQLECIRRLCTSLRAYQDQIIFRFSVGFVDE
jgi:DNA repair photolyase